MALIGMFHLRQHVERDITGENEVGWPEVDLYLARSRAGGHFRQNEAAWDDLELSSRPVKGDAVSAA